MTETDFLKTFGKRLAKLRKDKNLSQEKLAELVDLHRTYIGFIEQGVRNPTIANIYKISQALEIDLVKLFAHLS